VADPNPTAYFTTVCNLKRIENDKALGNSPLWFGEWSLATQFGGDDSFMRDWADVQKLKYGEDKGWLFWNFKTEEKFADGSDMAKYWCV
jgi:glucan endo-1,6-beta-glucosidase